MSKLDEILVGKAMFRPENADALVGMCKIIKKRELCADDFVDYNIKRARCYEYDNDHVTAMKWRKDRGWSWVSVPSEDVRIYEWGEICAESEGV